MTGDRTTDNIRLSAVFETSPEAALALAHDAIRIARDLAPIPEPLPVSLIADLIWIRDEHPDETLSEQAVDLLAQITFAN